MDGEFTTLNSKETGALSLKLEALETRALQLQEAHTKVEDDCEVFFIPRVRLPQWLQHYRAKLQTPWDRPFLKGKMVYPQKVLKVMDREEKQRDTIFNLERKLFALSQ